MPLILFEGAIFADYYQFYIADAGGPVAYDLTDAAFIDRLQADPTCVVLFTESNTDVPVRVMLYPRRPPTPTDADHVVLAGLSTQGELIVAGPTEYVPDTTRVSVPAGQLGMLVAYFGLGTAPVNERYDLHLWPGRVSGSEVLVRWLDA